MRHSRVSSQQPEATVATDKSTMHVTTNSSNGKSSSDCYGVALGPEWVEKAKLRERIESSEVLSHVGKLEVEYGQEVCGILSPQEKTELLWQRISTNESIEKGEYLIANWTEPSERYPIYLHTTENKVSSRFLPILLILLLGRSLAVTSSSQPLAFAPVQHS